MDFHVDDHFSLFLFAYDHETPEQHEAVCHALSTIVDTGAAIAGTSVIRGKSAQVLTTVGERVAARVGIDLVPGVGEVAITVQLVAFGASAGALGLKALEGCN